MTTHCTLEHLSLSGFQFLPQGEDAAHQALAALAMLSAEKEQDPGGTHIRINPLRGKCFMPQPTFKSLKEAGHIHSATAEISALARGAGKNGGVTEFRGSCSLLESPELRNKYW